jgi:hypothetical protein
LPLFRRQRFRQLALWLALASVMLRALIPAGFMPEQHAARRGIVLAFCYADALGRLRAAEPLSVQQSKYSAGRADDLGVGHRIGAHPGCPFASAAAPGLPASLPIGVALFEASSRLDQGKAVSAVLALAHARPPTRGPPSYA